MPKYKALEIPKMATKIQVVCRNQIKAVTFYGHCFSCCYCGSLGYFLYGEFIDYVCGILQHQHSVLGIHLTVAVGIACLQLGLCSLQYDLAAGACQSFCLPAVLRSPLREQQPVPDDGVFHLHFS